ncbi:MAG: hypothetical protein ACKOPS_16035, partial [Cyanobium sp.]
RMEGPFLWALVLTDVARCWSECVPLPSRDGLMVRSALQELQTLMPLPLRGLDVDNDTAFMNEELERWCAEAANSVRADAFKGLQIQRPGLPSAGRVKRHPLLVLWRHEN